jgi:hypothetical protein
MSALWASPYNLAFDSLVRAKVRAHNAYGWGAYSTVNTVGGRVKAVPSQMSAPVIASYSDLQINVTWSPLTSPSNGNSPILSYQLFWDNGSGTPSIQLVSAQATWFMVPTAMITPGTTYSFAVKATNLYGSSPTLSATTQATARTVPGKVSSVTVVKGTGTEQTSVVVSWDLSTPNHGASIDQYQVEFLTATGTWVSSAYCTPSLPTQS